MPADTASAGEQQRTARSGQDAIASHDRFDDFTEEDNVRVARFGAKSSDATFDERLQLFRRYAG